ncbi:hypothetical protein GALL_510810 [mine drainage metagenome]|uniref:Uncharacterized protein n=1 Tax=mine drainage metagenome TaxID=410659 RepID=A0A1J5PPW6_9ZZZZ
MMAGLVVSTIFGDVIGVIVIFLGGSLLQGLAATMLSGVGCMLGFSIFLAAVNWRRETVQIDDDQCLPTASALGAAANSRARLHGAGKSGPNVKHGLAREHHHSDVL